MIKKTNILMGRSRSLAAVNAIGIIITTQAALVTTKERSRVQK